MRPSAIVQAAIEILGDLKSGDRPLYRRLQDWARANRYAGSKDRARLSALIYGVVHDLGRAEAIAGSTEPRSLVIATLRAHMVKGTAFADIE